MDTERLAIDLRLAIAQEVEGIMFTTLRNQAEFLSWHPADTRSLTTPNAISWAVVVDRAVSKMASEGKLS